VPLFNEKINWHKKKEEEEQQDGLLKHKHKEEVKLDDFRTKSKIRDNKTNKHNNSSEILGTKVPKNGR